MGIKCWLLTYDATQERPCDCGDPECDLIRAGVWWRPNGTYTQHPWSEPPGTMWTGDVTRYTEGTCASGWTNCNGEHIHVILPGGHQWDMMGRAHNCGLPEDTVHRCWIVRGTPPNLTVSKDGNTCPAGAGSILVPGWHGFLRGGELVECC